jgi:hypothetical protein
MIFAETALRMGMWAPGVGLQVLTSIQLLLLRPKAVVVSSGKKEVTLEE